MPTLGHCKEQRRKISIRSARSARDLVGTLSSATEPTFLHSLEKRCSDIVQKTPTLGPGLAWLPLQHCCDTRSRALFTQNHKVGLFSETAAGLDCVDFIGAYKQPETLSRSTVTAPAEKSDLATDILDTEKMDRLGLGDTTWHI